LGNKRDSFVGYVELHERAWGMDTYSGRPKLEDILGAPIVTFWYPAKGRESRQTVMLFTTMKELNEYLSSLVLESKVRQPEKRLARLFVRQKRVQIKGVQLIAAYVDEE
jgi:hypothetical protein